MQLKPVHPVRSAQALGGRRGARHSVGHEEGQALIGVVITISLVLLMLLVAISITQFSNKTIARQLIYEGQALNAAQAGITDSLSWFRRQNGVVVTFAPQFNPPSPPGINDTDCPTVNAAAGCPNAGIVRTFDVSKAANLKGRYEAVIGTVNGTTGVVDVTSKVKSGAAAGTVWQLESTGYVWIKNDGSKNFNQSPNMIISKQTVRTQIQRLTITLPEGGSAVFAGANSKITLGGRSKLKGGTSLGLAYTATSFLPTENGVITGTPGGGQHPNSAAPYDLKSVFSVTQPELFNLADVQYTAMADVPSPLPAMSLVIYTGNAVFNSAKPLMGSGILVVFGDLSISGITNSSYSGVIYVTGNFTMDNPSSVDGAIIANASGTSGNIVSIGNGAGSDIAELDYDPTIMTQINKQMGQYRFTRSMAWVGK